MSGAVHEITAALGRLEAQLAEHAKRSDEDRQIARQHRREMWDKVNVIERKLDPLIGKVESHHATIERIEDAEQQAIGARKLGRLAWGLAASLGAAAAWLAGELPKLLRGHGG